MKIRQFSLRAIILCLFLSLISPLITSPIHAGSADAWWDDAWPYRLAVSLSKDGTAAVNLNFTELFENLGLASALLDLRSVRVVAYQNGSPIKSIPYQETYSTPCVDTDRLNEDPLSSEPYWDKGEDTTLTFSPSPSSQDKVIHAFTEIGSVTNFVTGFKYDFNSLPGADWSAYETLLYEVYPQVNASAVDQTPDVYFFKLGGIGGCGIDTVGGPALAMDQWNPATVSLKPFGSCSAPDLSSLISIGFFMKVADIAENRGYFEPGDSIDLWLDQFQCVNQDSNGEIRWKTLDGADKYYIYFDTLNHTGHPRPELVDVGSPDTYGIPNLLPEAGGYFHKITGAAPQGLNLWQAPITEKIFQTNKAPVVSKPLKIQAARGEMEAFQVVVRSPETKNLKVTVSPAVHTGGTATIPQNRFQVFRVDNVPITMISDHFGRQTLWPDPLYPVSLGQSINFAKGKNQSIWIRVDVPPDASPGIYNALITIGTAKIPFKINVWNFSLPQTPYLDSKFGFDWDTVMETYKGTVGGVEQKCYDQLKNAIDTTFAQYHLTPSEPEDDPWTPPPEILVYSLTAYELETAQNFQNNQGKQVWWQFNHNFDDIYIDEPPLPNPVITEHPGIEARMLPWLAWMDRIDGLYYPQTTDWDPNPWDNPFSNDLINGERYFFYPPKDTTIAFDPCISRSNRLVPSIRLELLREGLEDYAYFLLLNNGAPQIGTENQVDLLLNELIQSRTAFSRIPNAMEAIRAQVGEMLSLPIEENKTYLPILLH